MSTLTAVYLAVHGCEKLIASGGLLQALGIVAVTLTLLYGILWTGLRLNMPGEEKILTDAFRKRSA